MKVQPTSPELLQNPLFQPHPKGWSRPAFRNSPLVRNLPDCKRLIYAAIGVFGVITLAGAIVLMYVMRRNQKSIDEFASDPPVDNFENVPDEVTLDSFEDPYDLDKPVQKSGNERRLDNQPNQARSTVFRQ